MALDKIWEDDVSRAVEVLGGTPQKYKRMVDDRLSLTFTIDEWNKLFNVAEGYLPCSLDGIPYKTTQPVQINFVRKVLDEHS